MGVSVRQKNGKWYVFINHRGRRKAKCVGTRKAAEDVKRKIEAKLALGEFGILDERSKSPLFEDYAERWLREYAQIECKPATVKNYELMTRLYLNPYFAKLTLNEISREHVKAFLAEKSTQEQTRRQGRFSRNTLRLMICVLREMLNHAVDDGLIERNPAARVGRFSKSEKSTFQASALTREESERLLEAAKECCPEYHPLFLTALRAGLRRGELVALQWGDIQFGASEDDPNRYIRVQRNYVLGQFTSPKAKKSRRVDLGKQLRRELLRLKDECLLRAFQEGRESIADQFVFPSKVGTVLDPDNLVRYHFLPCVERAGLRRIRFHDLRHTFGSQLIQDGASLVYVKDQMGHSSIQVTVDIYGHLIPSGQIGCIDRLDSARSGATESATSESENATPVQPAVIGK